MVICFLVTTAVLRRSYYITRGYGEAVFTRVTKSLPHIRRSSPRNTLIMSWLKTWLSISLKSQNFPRDILFPRLPSIQTHSLLMRGSWKTYFQTIKPDGRLHYLYGQPYLLEAAYISLIYDWSPTLDICIQQTMKIYFLLWPTSMFLFHI